MYNKIDSFTNEPNLSFCTHLPQLPYRTNPIYPYPPNFQDFQFNAISSPQPFWPFQRLYPSCFQHFHDAYYSSRLPWTCPPLNHHISQKLVPEVDLPLKAINNSQKTREGTIKQEHCQGLPKIQEAQEQQKPKRKYSIKKNPRIVIGSYYWSPDENKRYYDFLKSHKELFKLTLNEKKNLKVNVIMSKKIKTRDAEQCHSHHQKMMKKYGTLQNLLCKMTFERQKKRKEKPSEKVRLQDQVVKDQIKNEDNL